MTDRTRASDDDRQQVVDVLQSHTAAGRLTLDEFSDRVGHVYAARTLGELQAVTADLPAPGQPAPDLPVARGQHRELVAVFAVAVVALLLLVLFMALTR